jgi:hypothetical protein
MNDMSMVTSNRVHIYRGGRRGRGSSILKGNRIFPPCPPRWGSTPSSAASTSGSPARGRSCASDWMCRPCKGGELRPRAAYRRKAQLSSGPFVLNYFRQRPALPHRFPTQDISYCSRCARAAAASPPMGLNEKLCGRRRCRPYKQKRPHFGGVLFVLLPAATYSPTQFPMQYHRRYQA